MSQITLDNVYDGTVEFAYLEGEHYFSIDYINNECSIYSLDYALKQKISIEVPTDWYLNDVSYISAKIFNDDDQIELLAVFYRYIPDTDTTGHYEYHTRVVSESGAVLLDVPGGGYSSIFSTSEGSLKLMVNVYDFSVYVFIAETNIYSLPGEAASSVTESGEIELMNAYPNPTNTDIQIPYRMNSANRNATLILVNINGQEVMRLPVENKSGQLLVPTGNLPAGQYIYYLQNNGYKTAAKKFVVR